MEAITGPVNNANNKLTEVATDPLAAKESVEKANEKVRVILREIGEVAIRLAALRQSYKEVIAEQGEKTAALAEKTVESAEAADILLNLGIKGTQNAHALEALRLAVALRGMTVETRENTKATLGLAEDFLSDSVDEAIWYLEQLSDAGVILNRAFRQTADENAMQGDLAFTVKDKIADYYRDIL